MCALGAQAHGLATQPAPTRANGDVRVQSDAPPSSQRVIKMEKFFVDEPRLWRTLKATRYYRNLSLCVAGDRALPFRDWLKVMLHIPSTLSVTELVRIYDEEDTMTILATVRAPPCTRGSAPLWSGVLHLYASPPRALQQRASAGAA